MCNQCTAVDVFETPEKIYISLVYAKFGIFLPLHLVVRELFQNSLCEKNVCSRWMTRTLLALLPHPCHYICTKTENNTKEWLSYYN